MVTPTGEPDGIAESAADPAGPAPSLLAGGVLLALLLSLYTLSYIDRIVLSLLIEPLKRSLKLDDLQVSLLIGPAFSLFYATMGLPLGYVADRWSRRWLIAVGAGLWSIMTGLGGIAQSFVTLFVARMGVGLGEAALSPAAYSMIGDSFDKRHIGRATAIYAIGVPLGSGLALLLGGLLIRLVAARPSTVLPLIGQVESWRAALLIVAVPGLLLAAAMLLLREPPRRAAVSALSSDETLLQFLRRSWRYILTAFGGMALVSAQHYAAFSWTPSLFTRSFGLPPSDAAVPIGVITAIGGPLAMLVGGTLGDRLLRGGIADAYARVFAATGYGSIVFMIAFPLAPSPILALILLGLGVFAIMLQGGLPAATISLIAPQHLRARVVAIYILTQGLVGLGAGPVVVALFSRNVFGEAGLAYSMAASAAALLLPACILLLFAPRELRKILPAAAAEPLQRS